MTNLKLYAWISRGKQRIPIIKAMYKPMTPTEIRRHSIWDNPRISLNNTSDVLRAFRGKKLVVCVNDDDRKGRLYKLTKEGEEVRKMLEGEYEKICV